MDVYIAGGAWAKAIRRAGNRARRWCGAGRASATVGEDLRAVRRPPSIWWKALPRWLLRSAFRRLPSVCATCEQPEIGQGPLPPDGSTPPRPSVLAVAQGARIAALAKTKARSYGHERRGSSTGAFQVADATTGIRVRTAFNEPVPVWQRWGRFFAATRGPVGARRRWRGHRSGHGWWRALSSDRPASLAASGRNDRSVP